jgi:hypothetical protein
MLLIMTLNGWVMVATVLGLAVGYAGKDMGKDFKKALKGELDERNCCEL